MRVASGPAEPVVSLSRDRIQGRDQVDFRNKREPSSVKSIMDRRNFVASTFLLPVAAVAPAQQRATGVRITVLKRSVQKEFQKYSWGPIPICERVKEGQQFLVTSEITRAPEGFCESAWDNIRKTIYSIRDVGPERTVACCTDGFRPVFFLLERVV